MAENSSGNSLLAFILGGLVGAGLALLYAPASGEETKKRLREEVERARGRVRAGYESAVDTVEEGVGRVKESVEEKKGEIRAAYEAGKEGYQREKEKHAKGTA